VGFLADIVMVNPKTIRDMATFEDPFHYPIGMQYVFVNGTEVINESKYTHALPGHALRGLAYVNQQN
jgi:N-acyl-D-aspartate/D-glutamate deacylase